VKLFKNEFLIFCFFITIGIKQTAKLVNSTLMELINGVEDNTDVIEKDEEVINNTI